MRCKCGGERTVRLTYEKRSRRGITRYQSGPMCTRCADKEAFAVLARGVAWVKADRWDEKTESEFAP